MPGYETKQERVAVSGVSGLVIRSLLDRQPFFDPLGLALPSLVRHRRGVDMTASDCHPLASRFLRNNLRLNHMAPMKYRHGAWNAQPPTDAAAVHSTTMRERYDLLLGSDLLYDRDASVALAGFIERHAMAAAEVWIVDPDRGNRPAFTRRMQDNGFALYQRFA